MGAQLPYSSGNYVFDLDGHAAALCKSVSGFQYKADVAETKSSNGSFSQKSITKLSLEPGQFEMGLSMGKPMIEWMQAFFAGEDLRKSGMVHACNYKGESMATREFSNALISELGFPACDASSKDSAFLTLKCIAETVKMGKGTGSKVGAALSAEQKKFNLQAFEVEIAGLPCDGVAKVDAFKCELKHVKAETGKKRDYLISPSSKSVSNLKLTINNDNALADWENWYRSFVVDGNCSQKDEKTGVIKYLAQDQKTVLMTVEFSGLGITSLDWGKAEGAGDKMAQFSVDMYVEQMKIS